MANAAKVYGLIVAAGNGSRFGKDLPKQYMSVAGKTILEHAVRSLNSPVIHHLTIVLSENDTIAKTLNFNFSGHLSFAIGGAERFLSVKNGLDAIKSLGALPHDWVLIHDAARPCLDLADLQNLLTDAYHEPYGAILATPVVDTLKKCVPHSDVIDSTVSRDGLWQAQTPQMFRLGVLESMLHQAVLENWQITDEASGFEKLGLPIRMIAGSRTNIKLTYPEDLALIELLICHNHSNAINDNPST